MKFLLIALALFATSAQAGDLFPASYREHRSFAVPPGHTAMKVLQITNDRDKDFYRWSLLIDGEGKIAGLYNEVIKGRAVSSFTPADGISWLRDIEKSNGTVLVESQGHNILLLKGKLNRETQEGRFTLSYLANGLSNTFEACDFLVKKKDNEWFIQNAYTNKKVTSGKIVTWSLGLTTIEGICPKKK